MRPIACALLTLLFVSGCSKRTAGSSPAGDGKIVPLYADLAVMQERSALRQADSASVKRERDSIFAHYSLSEKDFQSGLDYYKSDMNVWKEFNEKVVQRLEELQRQGAGGKDSAR